MSDVAEPIILLTGATGQVGFELLRSLQGLGRVIAPDRHALDLANFDQIQRVVREIRPAIIVNPAAYTAVDRAETDEAAAMRLNGEAPGVLADEAKRIGAAVLHFSTDYVFDGTKEGAYSEHDPVSPLNVYGASKLAGERALEQVGGKHLVFRTSWIYGTRGRNFLRTMLRLAEDTPELRIVSDQVGAPTWAQTIAAVTAHIASLGMLEHNGDTDWWAERSGVYHLTSSGFTSWAAFAQAIFELAAPARPTKVIPIRSTEYPTPAQRPKNSRLSNDKLTATFNIRPPDWLEALRLCVASLTK